MPRIQHQVFIECEPVEVFTVTNDIDRWTELFDAYTHSQVLDRENTGRFSRLTFRLKNREGFDWRSWRILDHQALESISEREFPLYPFVFMHLRWTYVPEGAGTLMTWTQDFELHPEFPVPIDEMLARMDAHGHHNQGRIKAYLEGSA